MFKLQGDFFESLALLQETLNERSYFLQSAPYQNKELTLCIPSKSLFWALCWFYPACIFYHLVYKIESMKTNFKVAVSGPSLVRPTTLRGMYPGAKGVHDCWGVLLHEVQMNDSR